MPTKQNHSLTKKICSVKRRGEGVNFVTFNPLKGLIVLLKYFPHAMTLHGPNLLIVVVNAQTFFSFICY